MSDWSGRPQGRRDFLARLGGLGALAALGPLAVREESRGSALRFGIQLYAVRDVIKDDVPGTLTALGEMGYREVELAGLYGKTAGEFRAALRAAGLVSPSSHLGLPALTDHVDQTIADAKVLGHQYLIFPGVDDDTHDPAQYRQLAETLNRAGAACRRAGLTVGYHNHSVEFSPYAGAGSGREGCGYDTLLRLTDPKLVVFEMDLYWVRHGGGDALRYLSEHKGRFRAVHVKDMAADGSMVDVGAGVMDWKTLLRAARGAGVSHFFTEHDDAKDELAFARASAEYLKHLRL